MSVGTSLSVPASLKIYCEGKYLLSNEFFVPMSSFNLTEHFEKFNLCVNYLTARPSHYLLFVCYKQ